MWEAIGVQLTVGSGSRPEISHVPGIRLSTSAACPDRTTSGEADRDFETWDEPLDMGDAPEPHLRFYLLFVRAFFELQPLCFHFCSQHRGDLLVKRPKRFNRHGV
jgi:hypothetical protein